MHITVFGSSHPKPGSPAYAEAYQLGKLLAQAGHVVLTGGYMGTMEAVSRGANEAGGHVVGVTCDEIEGWRPVGVNAWVLEERRFTTLQERMEALIRDCDAALALAGGPGTLAEIALTWNLMIIASIPQKPLILIGGEWRAVFKEMFLSLGEVTPPQQRKLLGFAPDIQAAIKMLEQHD